MKKKNSIKEEAAFERLNNVFMKISKIYIKWHNTHQDFGIDEKLYRSEIHAVQAIANNPGINLTNLAKFFDVTKPTMSQKINKLIKLKLIRKQANPLNEKEIMFVLTDKGWEAHKIHERNHKKLFKLYQQYFADDTEEFTFEFENQLLQFYNFLKGTKNFLNNM
jgi:DNA-binding MarR family transcriptional regulator